MKKLIAQLAHAEDAQLHELVFEADTRDPNFHRTAAFAVLYTFHPDFGTWILNLPSGVAQASCLPVKEASRLTSPNQTSEI